jgi:UDP-N-acetyl-D-mannosaminuronic acid dehydrogenase
MHVAIIGLGRVGLPLALFFDSLGVKVTGIDRDQKLLASLREKRMPFHEVGCDELLRVSKMQVSDSIAAAREATYIIITVGTPLHNHIEADLNYLKMVAQDLVAVLKRGHVVILRSTVAPETTLFLKQYLERHTGWKVGQELGLAFCPERLAENHALQELRVLPQIIGAEDPFSRAKAEELFRTFGVKLFFTDYVSAELVKLFNNISRYIEFALANQFAMIANQFSENIYEIIRLANENYPRGYIFSPGFTSGTCLRKDFGLLNERTPNPDLLLSAWKINEHMPYHLVEAITHRTPLLNKNVAVLGYTFKKNSDDLRDSLVPKLVRYIERQVPSKITICEPHLDVPTLDGHPNLGLNECLEDADVVFVAMNHDHFVYHNALKRVKKGAWVVDIWNCFGQDEFIFQHDMADPAIRFRKEGFALHQIA